MKGAFERRLEIFFVYLLPVIVVCSKTLSRGTPAYLSPNAPKINFRDQYKNPPCTKHRRSVTGDYLSCTNSTTSTTYCIYKVSPEITFLLSRHLVPPAVCTRPNPIPCFPNLGCTNVRANSFALISRSSVKLLNLRFLETILTVSGYIRFYRPFWKSGEW